MPDLLMLVFSVAIAAGIGGLTNYMAIRMLFHPRRPWKIGGWTIPLTPGLIPKRRHQIARSLGKVVGDYLVTSYGLKKGIRSVHIQQKLEQKLASILERHGSEDETFDSVIRHYVPSERYDAWMKEASSWSRDMVRRWLTRLWDEYKSTPIGEWTRRLSVREELPDRIADWLLTETERELASGHGDRWIRDLITRFMENGGWFGILAELMTDTDKLASRVRAFMLQLLHSAEAKRRLRELIGRQLEAGEKMSLEQWLQRMSGREEVGPWLLEECMRIARPETWPQRLTDMHIIALWPDYRERIAAAIPAISRYVLKQVESRIEGWITAINLPKLVENEVSAFPIEKVEELILHVSGKELKAITWFGAVLGGIIGLFQALMYMYIL